jgi:FkbM family methyltransferase
MKAYVPVAVSTEAEPEFGSFAPRGLRHALLRLARRTFLRRGFARRRTAQLVMGGRPVDIGFRGASYRIRRLENLIEYGLLLNPAYNHQELDFLIDATPAGGTFVDLGSNVGLYTLPLALKAGPSGRVVAIDANPGIMPILAFNAAASGLTNVHLVNVAVGPEEGRVDLEIHKDDLAIVSVRPDASGAIVMRPLLAILADLAIDRVDTLKADIEGFEDLALVPFFAAAPQSLKPRRVVIEHLGRQGWKTDLFPVFEREGYRLIAQTRGNSLFERSA